MADIFRLTAEERRSQINQSVVIHISGHEMADAARFQKQRTAKDEGLCRGMNPGIYMAHCF